MLRMLASLSGHRHCLNIFCIHILVTPWIHHLWEAVGAIDFLSSAHATYLIQGIFDPVISRLFLPNSLSV